LLKQQFILRVLLVKTVKEQQVEIPLVLIDPL
jgi:hypothetical protein